MCFSSIRCSYFSFIMPTCSWKKENISEPRISSIASYSYSLIIPGIPSNLIFPGTRPLLRPSSVQTLLLFGAPSKVSLTTAGKGQKGILSQQYSSEAVPLAEPSTQVTYFFPGILFSSTKYFQDNMNS